MAQRHRMYRTLSTLSTNTLVHSEELFLSQLTRAHRHTISKSHTLSHVLTLKRRCRYRCGTDELNEILMENKNLKSADVHT